jgi:hypothetical protein
MFELGERLGRGRDCGDELELDEDVRARRKRRVEHSGRQHSANTEMVGFHRRAESGASRRCVCQCRVVFYNAPVADKMIGE